MNRQELESVFPEGFPIEEVEEPLVEGLDFLMEELDLSRIRPDDTVSLYFQEMRREPLLSHQEEIDLAKTIEAGREAKEQLEVIEDLSPKESFNLEFRVQVAEAARDRFIRANTRLVVSIAKRYCGNGVPFLDLIQEGNLSLMKAVEKFDYRKGNRFSTYATWWIRQAVARALPEQGKAIRVPVNASSFISGELKRFQQTRRELKRRLEHEPTIEELAEELECNPRKIRSYLQVERAEQTPISLDQRVGDEKDKPLSDLIEDKSSHDPEQQIDTRILLPEKLEEALEEILDPREARVLRLRYGLKDGEERTLEEVGERLGLTRERIRQIERDAFKKLRHSPEIGGKFRDYL